MEDRLPLVRCPALLLYCKNDPFASPERAAPLKAAFKPAREVTIAAGIRLANLATWLGSHVPLVRAMPNRPALIGAGITAACAGPGVGHADRAIVERVLSTAGPLVWLDDESLLDVVTAVSGSGPAYFFLLVEALEDAGASLGLPRDVARRLAAHTALGSGRMVTESPDPPASLREQVTSKGGTTAAALAVLERAGLRDTFAAAVAAAARRSAELADQFGAPSERK
jgi:pyrroline-5-carboxylate reductase